MKVYLASSWRNAAQPAVVAALRAHGHEAYDFRNPPGGDPGDRWIDVDPNWKAWTPHAFMEALHQPVAAKGYALDKAGLDWADAGLLLLPSGKSAHLEAGYLAGQGKPTIVMLGDGPVEPELMYKLCDVVCADLGEVLEVLRALPRPRDRR